MIKVSGKILALDVGEARVGVAVSDGSGFLASPLLILKRDKTTIDRVVDLARTLDVCAVLVGLPLNMDGTSGFQARKVERFAGRIGEAVAPIPIIMEDESESTMMARALRIERGIGQKKRRARIDAEAAAIFLQVYLDRQRS